MDKVISNERVMDAIYEAADTAVPSENLIETEELVRMCNEFVDRYTDAGRDLNGYDEFFDALNGILLFTQKHCFNVGLKTGISLITGADVPFGVEQI